MELSTFHKKGAESMLELLKVAESAEIHADYVLFNSWISVPKTIQEFKNLGYNSDIFFSSWLMLKKDNTTIPAKVVYIRNKNI